MPVKLSTTINKIQSLSNTVNSKLISELCEYMKKNGLSDSHINNTLKTNMLFSGFLGKEVSFYDVKNREQIINFLDSKMKNLELDPDKKWITTWNDYLGDIKYFFRWLYNYKLIKQDEIRPVSEWETPSFAIIKKKKTKRVSPYLESEIWDRGELELIIKYEKFKRNKAAISMMWDLDARNHEITLLKIKHIRLKEKYGEGEIPHQAKTGSGPFLLTFSFPYVRDWLNEHPFRNEPNARLFCNLYNGGQIRPDALWSMMKNLKNRIAKLLDSDAIRNKEKTKKLGEMTGIEPNKVFIKNLRNRWGSITKNNDINLNVNLIKTPPKIIDYIIIHELCHSKIKGHSYNFWNLLRKYVPDSPKFIEWLNINGKNLLS